MVSRILAFPLFALAACAQTVCGPTPQYSPCDILFDIPAASEGQSLNLQAEFRSPHHDTALVRAVWDGGPKWLIRYTPAEVGEYTYRLTSDNPALNGKEGHFTATDVNKPGWLRAANLHHFALVEGNALMPHLWMGAVVPGFPALDLARWKALVDTRASQHFNHLGVTLVDEGSAAAFQKPEFFRAAEEKLRYANEHGIVVDVAFFGAGNLINRLLPTHADREKWFGYALSRLAAFEVTWQGIEDWETCDNGREILKEIGGYLAALDPYKHTRSSRAAITSAPLVDDGWLRYRSYQTADSQVSAVEQQLFQYPAVNNFGAGVKDTAAFRGRLWNATADGQYPATEVPNEEAAGQMKVWYEFMQGTRHWELEPFFDIDNGRGLALEGVEYVVYVEKPGPVTVNVEKQGYDIEWLNPVSGERIKVKEKGKSEALTLTPPDLSHDWVLHISKEGRKAGMLKSYKFDSRDPPLILQEVEGNPEKVPFDIVEPSADTLSLGAPVKFSVKLKRQSKALRNMMFEWTGEVTAGERSYRVIGTGASGTLNIPANIAPDYPASLHIKLTGMNGLGKVYILDRNYTLNK
ncbi:MAG: DUF5060 domain-containing protein [Acidobacteriota bacterium]